MLHKFKLGHNATKATKNIYCAKGEGMVDYKTVTRQFKKFHFKYKDFDDQTRSSKIVDSNAML